MKKFVMAALGGTVAGALLTTQVAGPLIAQEAAKDSSVYEQLDLFGDIFERIRAQYVEPVETEALVEAAINGMLTSLDPHSSYLSAKDFDDMQVQTRGEFGGLGHRVDGQLAPFDGDLSVHEFVLRRDADPLTRCHGDRAGDRAGQPRQAHDRRVDAGGGEAEDQRHVRHETVVHTEHGGTREPTRDRAVTSMELVACHRPTLSGAGLPGHGGHRERAGSVGLARVRWDRTGVFDDSWDAT